MSHKKVQAAFMNPGASSLLMIFLVLSIAVFATLTLSGAQNDHSFSKELAAHKAAYYKASNQSEYLLNELDSFLAETAATASDSRHFYEMVTDDLHTEIQSVPILIEQKDGLPTLSWQIPIDDNQALLTKVCLQWPYDTPSEGTGFYRIETWQTITMNE